MPDFAPLWVKSNKGMFSNMPPTLPWLARNSLMMRVFQSFASDMYQVYERRLGRDGGIAMPVMPVEFPCGEIALEGMLSYPEGLVPSNLVVVCHPHPQR